MQPSISVRNLSKCYKLGVISRQTLVDEVRYWWSKVRGRDPREHFTKIGHTATEALRIEAENARDDRFWALKDVSFDVQPGEVIGIIGRNGAGKSTLLKILTRITEPTSGEAIINGHVGSLLEVGTGFHPELTGRENIYMNGTILGMKKREIDARFDEIVAFSEIEKFLDTPVKRYSSGMYVRLAFAIAAHLEPEILVIDEVLAVGDADFQKKCLGKMGEISKEGRTVLFVSHNMGSVESLCNRSILIQEGIIVEDGLTQDVINSYQSNISQLVETADLHLRTDRSGNGRIKLHYFHVENSSSDNVSTIRSGEDAIFVFLCRCSHNTQVKMNIDIGFSVHTVPYNNTLSVLYSSYQGKTFDVDKRIVEFRCLIKSLPLAKGRYKIGGRITINGDEADWLHDGIGYIEVIDGDFYRSGKIGFGSGAPFLIKGEWSVQQRSSESCLKK